MNRLLPAPLIRHDTSVDRFVNAAHGPENGTDITAVPGQATQIGARRQTDGVLITMGLSCNALKKGPVDATPRSQLVGDRSEGRPEGDGLPIEHRLRLLLQGVAQQTTSIDEALRSLRTLPFTDLGFAKVDHHRELRQGYCEIVYAEGKTIGQVTAIVDCLLARNGGPVLVSRGSPEQLEAVRLLADRTGLPVRERPGSRMLAVLRNVPPPAGRGLILTGGTADLPVADEAALTASVMGVELQVHADVGVAGLHRLAGVARDVEDASVIVVVAGMEAALASVVGGLAACPVIACPTSIGYGASFGGLAALLSMLNACTPGVACVNIDDGVGAGYLAGLIARRDAMSQ